MKHKDWDKAAKHIDIVTDGVLLLQKPHSNPAQRWKRTLEAAQTAIDDLLILANSLPEEKRTQLFTIENAQNLVDAMNGVSLFERIGDEKQLILNEYNARIRNETDQRKKIELSDECHDILVEMDKSYLLQPEFNIRTIGLAANIANRCLDYCYKQYQKIETDYTFQSLTHEAFQQAKSLTDSIVRKVEGQAAISNKGSRK